MVFGQAWYLRSSYQEIYDRALVVSVTALGAEYEKQLNGEMMNKSIGTIICEMRAKSSAGECSCIYGGRLYS
ncbi:hypothetical protein B0E46_11270 [Rhodanobacter sp. B04]|nr:hypothetical protein B0E46_11270 [Rhodanobacter sp. B04]